MSGPFKQKGWEAYTKVKDKPIKPSENKTSKGTLREYNIFDRIDNWRDRLVAKIKEKFQ